MADTLVERQGDSRDPLVVKLDLEDWRDRMPSVWYGLPLINNALAALGSQAAEIESLTKRNATFSAYLDIPEHEPSAEAIAEHCVQLQSCLSEVTAERDALYKLCKMYEGKNTGYVEQLHKVAALEAQLEQHQWHRVEDELPEPARLIDLAKRPGDYWILDNQLSDEFEIELEIGEWTHWRYSSPPDGNG